MSQLFLAPEQVALTAAIEGFWATIPPLWGQVRAQIRTTAAQHFDISVEQFHILRHVRNGLVSVRELAEARQISRPAISQAVETLVERGLLTRTQSTEDRRFVQLALTPAGNDLLDAVFAATRSWMAERLAGLSADELNTVIEAMRVLKRSFVDVDR